MILLFRTTETEIINQREPPKYINYTENLAKLLNRPTIDKESKYYHPLTEQGRKITATRAWWKKYTNLLEPTKSDSSTCRQRYSRLRPLQTVYRTSSAVVQGYIAYSSSPVVVQCNRMFLLRSAFARRAGTKYIRGVISPARNGTKALFSFTNSGREYQRSGINSSGLS